MKYFVVVWTNAGTRIEDDRQRASCAEAEKIAKTFRTAAFRTVKVCDTTGESLYHWKRYPLKTQPNKWVRVSTAEVSRVA